MWKCEVATRAGRNKRNEDRYEVLECDDASVYALADGMGGRSHGDVAAEIAVKEICGSDWDLADMEQSFQAAFERADMAIAQKSEEMRCKMGCAVGCLVVTGDMLYYAGLGDIRLYAQEEDGALVQLSTDNVICGKNGESFLTRSVRGRGVRKPLRIFQCLIGAFCRISLCSDGFYKNDPDDDATNIEIKKNAE